MKINTPLLLTAIALLEIALLPQMRAVSPAPDGCYPNFTTAEGCDALNLLTTGAGNTGLGWRSLFLDTTGNFNTAVGGGALALNNADSNTAVGAAALLLNTTGSENTAVGTDTLVFNDSGSGSTAVGYFALMNNTNGGANTATGFFALLNNTSGNSNTASGVDAAVSNTTGGFNTAIGLEALDSNTDGSDNTAIGAGALGVSTGSSNTALGFQAGGAVTTATNVICIGHPGADVNNSCFIGNIRNVTTVNSAIPVVIDTAGQLGTMSSSRRFKNEIKPMDDVSETILSLKPVTFQYKRDTANTPQFGLIAEEVAVVNPDLVVRDKKGEIYTVRYDAVNAMLLNEFLKEHRTVQELKKEVAALTATAKEQAAQIQKVSAQLEVTRSVPRVVESR